MRIINKDVVKLAGGGSAPGFATYINVPQPTAQAPQQSGQLLELLSLLDDKQKTLLNEKGLPSDVEYFYGMINQMGNNLFSSPFSSNGLNSLMSVIGSYLNKIAFNNNEFNRVVDIAKSNGGLSELAVTSTGLIVGLDSEGLVKLLTPSEYKEDSDKYRLLTNADLALLRANNPLMAFNSDIFNVILNGIGMDKINELLWNSITKLGKSSVLSDKYISKKGALLLGILELVDAPEGVYKGTSKIVTLEGKAKTALLYLYSTLPENAKTVLKAKAVLAGMDSKTGALQLMAMLIASGTSEEVSNSIDYDTSASKATGVGGSEGGGATEDVTANDIFLDWLTTNVKPFLFNPGSSLSFTTPIRVFNTLPDLENKNNPRIDVLSNAVDNTVLTSGRKDSISFGGKILSNDDLDLTLIDTSAGVGLAWLPYQQLQNGEVVPDLDVLSRIKEADKQIEDEGPMPDIRKKLIYLELDVGDYYGYEDWKGGEAYLHGLLRPFYLVNGVTSENTTTDDTNPYVTKLDNRSAKTYMSLYNRRVDDLKRSKDPVMGNKPFLGVFWDDNMYKGTIYIPVSDDKISTRALAGKVTQPKGYSDIKGRLTRDKHNIEAMTGLKTEFSNGTE